MFFLTSTKGTQLVSKRAASPFLGLGPVQRVAISYNCIRNVRIYHVPESSYLDRNNDERGESKTKSHGFDCHEVSFGLRCAMFGEKLIQRSILVVLFVLSNVALWEYARSDEQLESKILSLVNDLEFGLVDFASESLLTIESSPDSELWLQGTAKFVTLRADGMDYGRAEWDFPLFEDARAQPFSNYFDSPHCAVSKLKIRGVDYVNILGVDRWMKENPQLTSCVVVNPIDWPVIFPYQLNNRNKIEKPTFQEYYRSAMCANAIQIDARTLESIWYGKLTHNDGKRLGFQEIRFKDDLPVLYETYSYQKGFRSLNDLPRRKDCIRINRVETTWATFDDISVPRKVKAELSNGGNGGLQGLYLTVELKFWNSRTKEYKAIKKLIDEAIPQVKALEVAPKTK